MPRKPLVRAGVIAAALTFTASAAPASAQETLTPNATTDSLIATGIPFGSTTVQALRTDPVTGAPVVIGQYKGTSLPFLPFSVNTTTPTALNPGGDCWQAGALKLPGNAGLTPDLLPGDTVTVAPGGPIAVVPSDGGSPPPAGAGGPVPGCSSLSVFGRNAVTAATGGNSSDVTISGVAQPLATGVAVSATDGHATTPAITASLSSAGSWSATMPVSQLAALADGDVTVGAVYAVPDVATGTASHITGVPLSIHKQAIAGGVSLTPGTGIPAQPSSPGSPGSPAAPPKRLGGLRVTKRISLAAARRGGIRASFVVPDGARVVRLRLSHGSKTILARVVQAGRPGKRQTVHLSSSALKRSLRRGTYRVSVAAGPSRSRLGRALSANVVVR
jgi:hypothetical protein